MIKIVYRIIPKLISNRFLIEVFEWMRKRQRSRNERTGEYTERYSFPNIHIRGYIENQHIYKEIPYGRVTMAYAGCEIIAAYNVYLHLMKTPLNLGELIWHFERDGMIRNGKFGTSPLAVMDYLGELGFKTGYTLVEDEYNEFADKHRALILTMYNDYRNIGKQIHTIAITRHRDGYVAHNTYCNGTILGPCPCISELISQINDGYAKGICLIGLN